MLRDAVVVVVVPSRPRAIPLAIFTMRRAIGTGFYEYGPSLGGLSGRRSSANVEHNF